MIDRAAQAATLSERLKEATPRPWPEEWVHYADDTDPQDVADAALIVLAVNNIEALAAAAQGVLDSCNPHAKYPTLVSPESLGALQRALAKVAAP